MDLTPDPRIDFGQRLRELRRARGLSQEKLANLAELDRTYVSSCEAGRRNVTLKTMYKIAHALGVRPSALIGDSHSEEAAGLAAEEPEVYGACD